MACQPSEALQLLLNVYNNKVYVAKTTGQVRIYPVYFDEAWRASYGKPIDLADLSCDYTLVESVHIDGVRHIADFERSYYHADSFSGVATLQRHPLQEFYDVLGVTVDASEDIIKKAYRQKAHENHPDRDPSPDATHRMQQINQAYDEIMKQWK
ncbi:MAG: DnaJ domain-containing protein [Anaerolineae bacterium]|nr:DnaJ domain-containing protein [Anaerolineae bacterium]